MLCKLEGDKYSCSYLRKGQGRITDTTRLGLQAAQFIGQAPTLVVFYRQLICISYASWVMQKRKSHSFCPCFHFTLPPLDFCLSSQSQVVVLYKASCRGLQMLLTGTIYSSFIRGLNDCRCWKWYIKHHIHNIVTPAVVVCDQRVWKFRSKPTSVM